MPVKKRKTKSGEWRFRFDFEEHGERYTGPWVRKSATAAKGERDKRTALESGPVQEEAPCERYTLEQACAEYWEAVHQHNRDSEKCAYKNELILRLIGPGKFIDEIKTATVQRAITARRAEPVENVARQAGIDKRMSDPNAPRVQEKINRRNAALRAIAAGATSREASKATGADWASCKRYVADMRAALAEGKSEYEWLAYRESLGLRGHKVWGLMKYKPEKPRSTSTVNRDIIDHLRPILDYMAEVHELAMPRIAWKRLRLPDRVKVVREYSAEEELAWGAQLAPIEQVFLGTLLTYGARFGEMFFPPDALKGVNTPKPTLELGRYIGRKGKRFVSRKAKGDNVNIHVVKLFPGDARVLASLAGRAAAAGLETIWFDEDPVTGDLTPITYYAMHGRLTRGADRAGIKPGRIIHGARHHAGTQMVRRTNSLLLARDLLGHSSASTTERYAHVADDDMRAGIDAVKAQQPDHKGLPAPGLKQS